MAIPLIVAQIQPVEDLCTLAAQMFPFFKGLQRAAKDDVHNVDDTENQLQLAGSRDCRAALAAVSSNVKVPPRKVSDGACLTL